MKDTIREFFIALKEIFTSSLFVIFVLFDLVTLILSILDIIQVNREFYAAIIVLGFLFAAIHKVQTKNKLLKELTDSPKIVSNDNLSLDGPNETVGTMFLTNIGKGIAKVLYVSSDKEGECNIIDDHYMKNFYIKPDEKRNLMILESEIKKGILKEQNQNIKERLIDSNLPFYIYVKYSNNDGKNERLTKIKFIPGERYIRLEANE